MKIMDNKQFFNFCNNLKSMKLMKYKNYYDKA